MNPVTESFNTTIGQMTEDVSANKKQGRRFQAKKHFFAFGPAKYEVGVSNGFAISVSCAQKCCERQFPSICMISQ